MNMTTVDDRNNPQYIFFVSPCAPIACTFTEITDKNATVSNNNHYAYCTGTGIIKFCLAVPAAGKVRSKSISTGAAPRGMAGYHDAHVLKTLKNFLCLKNKPLSFEFISCRTALCHFLCPLPVLESFQSLRLSAEKVYLKVNFDPAVC